MIEQHHLADDAICPGCGTLINGATPIQANATPKPGDLSICCHCGCLLQFIDTAGHCEHLPASIFKALPKDMRKSMATLQATVLRAIKGGSLC